MTASLEVCILAAGLGKRMKSQKPKVLHELAGRPMLAHLLDAVDALGAAGVHVVIGKGAEQVRAAFPDRDVNWVMQAEQKGTGHAVMQALPHLGAEGKLLVLLGDAPLVRAETMQRLIEEDCDVAVLTVRVDNPFNYGRIVRGEGETIARIVEHRDAGESELAIDEINSGVMIMDKAHLPGWLERLSTDNDQGEYLLTDVIEQAAGEGRRVHAVLCEDENEVRGVNNFQQLSILEAAYRRRSAEALMTAGIRLADPERIDVRGALTGGRDCRIDVNCVFGGRVALGDGVSIGPGCVITDAEIGDGVDILPNCVIDGAVIESGCVVGPFARLRPGTHLRQDAAIGNFVEVKKTTVGVGSKASHLAYLGDAIIGDAVNIGAGTITCNYDGVAKHETHIGDHVFVGSNTALVAPVTIGERSTIGAGSTITRAVEAGELAVARGRQRNISQWQGPGGQ